MNAVQIAVVVTFAAWAISFVWAMARFFRVADETEPKALKVAKMAGLAFTVAHAIVLCQPGSVQGITGLMGLALYWISLALFWRCIQVNQERPLSLAFNTDQPEHLMADGPYRYIRHPFYTSYSLAWIAGIVASAQPWLLISLLVMAPIYYNAATMEERKFESSPLAGQYQEYRKRTGMFLPRLRMR